MILDFSLMDLMTLNLMILDLSLMYFMGLGLMVLDLVGLSLILSLMDFSFDDFKFKL